MSWVAAAVAAVGAISSMFSANAEARKIKKIGQLNERVIRQETAEEMRRFERESQETIGQSRAAMGASGLSTESKSFSTFLQDQQTEAWRQLSFIRSSGISRAQAARAGANQQASGVRAAGMSSFISGAANAANYASAASSGG